MSVFSMRIWTTVMGQRLEGAENTRSMLLCAELLRRGHQVVMWTSAYDHIRKEWRKEWLASRGAAHVREDGLEIRFMRGCGYSRNVGLRRFVDHWLAARDFLRQAPALPRPDAIVTSLPDHITAAAAVRFGRRAGVPTIIDVRDKWPDIFGDYVNNATLAQLVRAGLAFEYARAARALCDADAVVAMMESMMDWGLSRAGRERTWKERIFYLTTAPKNFDVPEQYAPAGGKLAAALQAVQGRVVFSFVGTFNKTQHPSLILDAMDLLKREGGMDPATFAVVIGGDGIEAESVLRRAAEHANVWCTGWLSSAEMGVLLSRSDIGLLVMNFASPAFNNKAFAYLASGLPIINGATGDLADIIASQGAGLNVRGGDAAALAGAMRTLAGDRALRLRMTQNVRRLFCERFDREANYRAYADHVEQIARAPVGAVR